MPNLNLWGENYDYDQIFKFRGSCINPLCQSGPNFTRRQSGTMVYYSMPDFQIGMYWYILPHNHTNLANSGIVGALVTPSPIMAEFDLWQSQRGPTSTHKHQISSESAYCVTLNGKEPLKDERILNFNILWWHQLVTQTKLTQVQDYKHSPIQCHQNYFHTQINAFMAKSLT